MPRRDDLHSTRTRRDDLRRARRADLRARHNDLRVRQRDLAIYFHHWRLGARAHPSAAYPPLALINAPIPKPGRWPGFPPQQSPPEHRLRRPHNRVWDAAGPVQTEAAAREAVARRVREGLVEAGLRFVKVLGWGGLGVVALLEREGGGGRMVCKMDLKDRGDKGVQEEGLMHLRTAGAKHVVQRVVLNDRRAMRPASRASQVDEDDGDDYEMVDSDEVMQDMEMSATEKLDLDPQALFIEYLPRGRLDDYIAKVGEANTRFPDKVLWRIFECLFRGVVGMAYPDAFQTIGCNPRTENIPQVSETCAGFPILTSHCSRETMVHFDIDPLNVLVGEYDQGEHSDVPLLKIADLGIARIFNDELRMDVDRLWAMRRCGKSDILTPEHFSQEWDHIEDTPWEAQAATAGNFSWWTNLYQIMWSLITLHHPEYPPVVEQLQLTHPDGSVTTEWTYGGYLLSPRFAATSSALRNLVALCLVDNPNRRPAMSTLEETIERHVRGDGFESDQDRAAKEWAGQLFGGAPPPPEPVREFGGEGVDEGMRGGGVEEMWDQERGQLKGPEDEVAYRARMQAQEDERIREVNRIVGIRRAPRIKILVDRWAPGFVADLLI
ncbi:hypothetical protein C8A05DRAFT_18538 [Staphylotrichum tortipilum]|uniref:Protein kinase domain-containing protein n=1 Tax=Staphylotrichum tortipilum TaxID=2831512 RepID=A0AAN6RQP8_9PEZI|nr:hypothetical protein C8A05DRAFT_18538 [Staphylotrichum longicolle]